MKHNDEPKIAIVTGGTAGIGRAIAEKLVQDGWQVIVGARRIDKETRSDATSVSFVQLDVSDADSVKSLVAEISQRHGQVGLLVNCAGIALEKSGFATSTDDDMLRLFQVNVFGTMRMCRDMLPLLADGSCILNLSSTLSQRPRLGSTIYSATKGAIDAFSKSLAIEVAARRIRVHVIAPGLVRSRIYLEAGMPKDMYDTLLETRSREFPLGRVGEPEDIAELAAFLASDRAAWMTGNCVQMDGGAMLR